MGKIKPEYLGGMPSVMPEVIPCRDILNFLQSQSFQAATVSCISAYFSLSIFLPLAPFVHPSTHSFIPLFNYHLCQALRIYKIVQYNS